MFAQHVSVVLKPHSVAEFTRTIKNQVIPLLRKQRGFQDEITFVVSDGSEALGITLWDQKENAAAYYRTTYPQVQEWLRRLLRSRTMRLPTRVTTRLPLVRQPAHDGLIYSSGRTGGQACPPTCSTKEQHLSGGHGTTVRGKQTPDHNVRVIATNLIRGTATVLAQYKAGTLAEVQQRIIPKPRQDSYEFQMDEFIETVEGTQGTDVWL